MSPNLSRDGAAEQTRTERTEEPAPATTAAVAEPTVERPVGDLDSGSLTRVLPAGAQSVVLDYWTQGTATSWTAGDDKTVQLSAHVEGGDGETEVLVTRFSVTADDGHSRTVAVEDRGEFALMPPFSYATAFTVPESAPDADAVTLHVQFDLLVETEPGSARYYRQTVLDFLELPLLQEDSQ